MATTNPTPESALSAFCLTFRHGRCRQVVITIGYVGACGCTCHQAPLPAAFAEQVAAAPPCELDPEEVAS